MRNVQTSITALGHEFIADGTSIILEETSAKHDSEEKLKFTTDGMEEEATDNKD